MKSQSFKTFSFVVVTTSMIFVASCNKTKLMPDSTSAEAKSVPTGTIQDLAVPSLGSYNPVYGVSQNNNLYSVDPATGNQTSLGMMTFGGGAEYPVNVTGIAQSVNPSTPNGYVVTSIANNPCLLGSGTTFFLGTFPSPALVRMGTLLGRSIKDIEYNPVDGFLYGMEGDRVVKILSLGVGCTTGVSPVAPVVVTLPGVLPTVTTTTNNIGEGPYSIAFNWAGQCNVVSAKSHKRAIIDLAASPTMTISPGTLFQGIATNMINPQELGFCISFNTLLIATNDKLTATTNDLSYYQFGTLSGVVGSWIEKSNNCLVDYTSKPQNNPIIKFP